MPERTQARRVLVDFFARALSGAFDQVKCSEGRRSMSSTRVDSDRIEARDTWAPLGVWIRTITVPFLSTRRQFRKCSPPIVRSPTPLRSTDPPPAGTVELGPATWRGYALRAADESTSAPGFGLHGNASGITAGANAVAAAAARAARASAPADVAPLLYGEFAFSGCAGGVRSTGGSCAQWLVLRNPVDRMFAECVGERQSLRGCHLTTCATGTPTV